MSEKVKSSFLHMESTPPAMGLPHLAEFQCLENKARYTKAQNGKDTIFQ